MNINHQLQLKHLSYWFGLNKVDRPVIPSGQVVIFDIGADLVLEYGEGAQVGKGLPEDRVRGLVTTWSHQGYASHASC